ncbi:hypothetical protein R3P38DRAFT_274710 [Favolaschia claudopus]|uniref:Cytochrome P450 n=1 Tax=Favolaschia claudopus TaxID=2862362 RepID=A0AAV9ZQ47_9AGAR
MSFVPSMRWPAAFALTVLIIWLRTRRCGKSPLPPGPRKLPLIGNLLDLTPQPWEACMEWSRKYGSDIIHLNLAGTSVVVLSSFAATDALLEKRSSIYCDRPSSTMVGKLMGWNFLLGGLLGGRGKMTRQTFD